jgi:hypothetical protein
MPANIAEVYRIMLALAAGEDDAASIHQRLDELRREFCATTRVFWAVSKDERHRLCSENQQLTQQLHAFSAQCEGLRRQIVDLRSEKAALLKHLNATQINASWRFAEWLYQVEIHHPNLVRKALALPRLLWWATSFKLPRRFAQRRQIIRILHSGLFDEVWYMSSNSEVIFNDTPPIVHWATVGWKEGRSPHLLFDVGWYLERYPEAAESEMDPLSHYLSHGAAAGYDPSPLFDTRYYLDDCPLAAESRLTPLVHYLREGAMQGCSPHPFFDNDWYMQQLSNLAPRVHVPLLHYLQYGADEGLNPNPNFDSLWYLDQYPDVAETGMNPLVHYLRFGAREGRAPSPLFDTVHTLRLTPADWNQLRQLFPLDPLVNRT